MKTNDKWEKLAAQARRAPQEGLPDLPYGFTTRVVARWQATAKAAMPSMWEWMSVRGLLVACGVMVLALGLNYDLYGESATSALPLSQETFDLIYTP